MVNQVMIDAIKMNPSQLDFLDSMRELVDFCEGDRILQSAFVHVVMDSEWILDAVDRVAARTDSTPSHIKLFMKLNNLEETKRTQHD